MISMAVKPMESLPIHEAGKKAVFLKPMMGYKASMEDGQCSKGKFSSEDDMAVDGDEGNDRETEGAAGKGKKEKDKWCFRCCSKGHLKEFCIVDLFCNICESVEHVVAKCPTKKNHVLWRMR